MSERFIKRLFVAVIVQAMKDWEKLDKKGLKRTYIYNDSVISKREIENFLKSEQCQAMLGVSGLGIRGNNIVKSLKAGEFEGKDL